MAGTKEVTEDLPGLVCDTPDVASSDVRVSVEGVDVQTLQDRATCYARSSDREYRWFQDSLDVPSFPDVLLPDGQLVSTPGRWIIIPLPGGVGAASYQFVQDEGTVRPQQPTLNFIGPGLDAKDDAGGTRTNVTLSTATASTIGTANTEGTADTLARSDHGHDHGTLGGGDRHALATGAAAGFLSAAGFNKLASIPTQFFYQTAMNAGAVIPQQPAYNFSGPGFSAVDNPGNTRTDVSVATAAASTIGTANTEGGANSLARSDHGHDHGALAGGDRHALAIAGGAAGFLSGADKTKLDGLSPGGSAYDFIISQASDLPAPVGGVITLTAGSYAFKNAINLGTDRINVPVGINVKIDGMGSGKILSSSVTNNPVLNFEGGGASDDTSQVNGLFVDNTAGAGTTSDAIISAASKLELNQCITRANNGAGVGHSAGILDADQCYALSCTAGYRLSGTAITYISNQQFNSLTDCLLCQGSTYVQWIGGYATGINSGVNISTGSTSAVIVGGVSVTNGNVFMTHTNGAASVTRISVSNTNLSGLGTGFQFFAGMPANGLAVYDVVGASITTMLSGFSAFSFGANIRGLSNTGGFLQETPIVP